MSPSEKILKSYYDLLCVWNKKINLTSIDNEDDFWTMHVEDSLALLPYIEDAKTVIDLGTGAGIPGLVLKIARPDLNVTVVDSTRKKVAFCEEVIRKLNLSGATAVWGRTEDKDFASKLGSFDLVVSRATWDLKKFLPIAALYMSNGSRCIAMKGPRWDDEIKDAASHLKENPLILEGVHPYKLKNGQGRYLIVSSWSAV